MPYLRVRIATSKKEADFSQKVATMLTQLAVSKLGKNAAAAAVDVKLANPADWFIGGRPLIETEESSFFVEVKITSATNSRDDKAAFVRAVYDQMTQLLGKVAKTSYVVLQDVASDSWGYGGKTQEYRYISGDTD
jgi:4-oxalocrotonate tautomerase